MNHKQFQHAFRHQIFKDLMILISVTTHFIFKRILLKPQRATTKLTCHRKEDFYQLQFLQFLHVTCADVETSQLLDLMHDWKLSLGFYNLIQSRMGILRLTSDIQSIRKFTNNMASKQPFELDLYTGSRQEREENHKLMVEHYLL